MGRFMSYIICKTNFHLYVCMYVSEEITVNVTFLDSHQYITTATGSSKPSLIRNNFSRKNKSMNKTWNTRDYSK